MSEEKVVPARANFKKQPVFVKATIADQAGVRPGYTRQWVHAKDPRHPQYFEKYMRDRYVGDQHIGYCKEEAWTVVQRKDAKPGRKRDDDTYGIETALTHGDLVCIETPDENAAVSQAYDKARRQNRAVDMALGDAGTFTADNAGRATFKARAGHGTLSQDPSEILKQE